MILNDGRGYTVQGDKAKFLYLGTKRIWPPLPMRITNFLKYYEANIPREFRVSYVVDPEATRNSFLGYQNTEFISDFQGPDKGIDPWIDPRDQHLGYYPDNISQLFNSFSPTGETDHNLNYDNINIPTDFIWTGTVVNEAALYDQAVLDTFLGPDKGIDPWIDPRDQHLGYYPDNISQLFNSFSPTGETDHNLNYDNINIPTDFIWTGTVVNEAALYDQAVLDTFLGPDAGIDININKRDQVIKYNHINIQLQFPDPNRDIDFDQYMVYSYSNFETEFLA